MTTPRSPSIGSSLPISAAARRIMLKVPMRLTRITFSKSASGCGPSRPTTRLATPMPAQLTSTRATPCAAAALASAAPAEASSATSPATARPRIALAASSAAAGLRSKTVTFAPLAATASAVARPSPEPPPVTIAATPVSFIALPPSARAGLEPPISTADAPRPRRHALRTGSLGSVEPNEKSAAFDLHRIGREVDAGWRPLRFAGGEIEPAVVHRAFYDRALNETVGELHRLVRAQAVGGEVAVVRRAVERILPAVMLERRDVLGQDPVDGTGVDPALTQLSRSRSTLTARLAVTSGCADGGSSRRTK